MQAHLELRNVVVNGHRTSMRLEPAFWEGLSEIARREGHTLHALVSLVDLKLEAGSLTTAVRVFVLEYFRGDASRRAALLSSAWEALEEDQAAYGHAAADAPAAPGAVAGAGDLARALAAVRTLGREA